MRILVIGGNRFFGKKLVSHLLENGHDPVLLNRGSVDDGFGGQIKRIQCDRTDRDAMEQVLGDSSWDLVYDQVCFDYKTAKEACEIFKGKAKSYVFTSSQSVYEAGSSIEEMDFLPENHEFDKEETASSNYGEAKRQAEVGFSRHASFPVTYIRFPIVIGSDDYTERFKFHVERVRAGKPIYFPNIKAKISFVTSDFAAQALAELAEREYEGPLNIASPEPIVLEDLIAIIEKGLGKKALICSEASDENHSPYGIDKDWFMNCGKLKEYGMVGRRIDEWLPTLLS